MASRLLAAASSSSASSSPLARLISSRRMAGAADHHGSTKVNMWQEPLNPGNWKEEHLSWLIHWHEVYKSKCNYFYLISLLLVITELLQFVLASLAMWGAIIYGGLKAFGGKKEVKTESCKNFSRIILVVTNT
ncbi:hypothetical protein CFC21_098819 [Triticum aestivum]|uniref:Uncharacterized protein n=3 Tax=Triticum TaxID=4564 RepID=A0A9R1BQX4_TRITD|nr:hypothetical protein CFC21_098819 [Triticum aestivum]VAI77904.1 unnamed protein product [Triticum turgidum subsp. durum]